MTQEKAVQAHLAVFSLIVLMGWLFALLSWFFPYVVGLNQAITFVGILLFAGLTVWDT